MEIEWFRRAYKEILEKAREALEGVDEEQLKKMLDVLLEARYHKILVMGVGRSGLVARAFAMRLMHLGFNVYVLGETITPAMTKDDVFIAISGSGSSTLVVAAAKVAKDVGATVIAITSFPDSPLGKLADHVVVVKGRTKVAGERDYFSRQLLGIHEPLAPLGTIFETSCMIFLDSIIASLMKRLGLTEEDLKRRHATVG